MSPPRQASRGEKKLLLFLIAVAVLCWLPRLFTPLWRDEAITWWIIKDGWGDALARAGAFQEWSTAYFLLLKGLTFAAPDETLLRLPSLAAGAVCARAVYLAGLRLKDERAGLVAALSFCISGAALMYSNEARPYGPALAFSALSLLFLIRSADEGRPAFLAAYALCMSASAYMHLTAAAIFPAHVLYWAWRRFAQRDAAPASGAALVGAAALMLPLCWPALSAFSRRDGLMFAEQTSAAKFLFHALPPDLLIGAAAGLWLFRPVKFDRGSLRKDPVSPLILALGTALIPLVLFFTASQLFGVRVWVPRYFICHQIGISLTVGLLFSYIMSEKALKAAAIGMAALSLGARTRLYHINEDWAGAVAYASARAEELKAPVMLTCPYIESLRQDWLEDSSRREYLTAPFSFYDPGARTVLLPLPAPEGEPALRRILRGESGIDAAVVLSLGDDGYNERLDMQLKDMGLSPAGRRAGKRFPRAYVYTRQEQRKNPSF